MTEQKIQDWLHGFSVWRNHHGSIPNIFLYAWESDFISITMAGYVHEYEIKISKQDFKKDRDKKDKHEILKTGKGYIFGSDMHNAFISRPDYRGHEKTPHARPNYFWYVCPKDLILPTEVPEYAGLIYTCGCYGDRPIKKAPLLHKEKVSIEILTHISKAFQWKYWSLRNQDGAHNDILGENLQPTTGASTPLPNVGKCVVNGEHV